MLEYLPALIALAGMVVTGLLVLVDVDRISDAIVEATDRPDRQRRKPAERPKRRRRVRVLRRHRTPTVTDRPAVPGRRPAAHYDPNVASHTFGDGRPPPDPPPTVEDARIDICADGCGWPTDSCQCDEDHDHKFDRAGRRIASDAAPAQPKYRAS